MVAIVLDLVGADCKLLRQDLSKEPIWSDEPERAGGVDGAVIVEERGRATQAGIRPQAGARMSAALPAGGEELKAGDKHGLLKLAAELVRKIAPAEADRAGGLDPR